MRPINLLPPEDAARREGRRGVVRMALVVLAFAVLLALLTVLWQDRLAAARGELAAEEAVVADLQRQVAGLRDAEEVLATYEELRGLVASALENDVSWARILNDLGRIIPDRVWLTSLDGSSAAEDGVVGTFQASGVGFDVPDVAAWLRALESDAFPAVGGTWVSSIDESRIGEVPVVDFTSLAYLTDAARSGRERDRVPEVGG